LKAGELVVGATQERTLTGSQVVMPGEKVTVGCACVHATKGIRAGQSVKSGGISPVNVRGIVYDNWRPEQRQQVSNMPFNHLMADEINLGGHSGAQYAYTRDLQNKVWGGVKAYSASMSDSGNRLSRTVSHFASAMPHINVDDVASAGGSWRAASDDLASRITESREKFASVLKSVPLFDHQAGIVLLTMNGIESLDAFDNPDSWGALREAYLKAEAGKVADTSDQDNVFQFREDKAREAIRSLLTGAFEEAVSVNKSETQTFVLVSPRFTGEVVTLYELPIHATFVKKA
jgi:hypothetical protein